MEGYDIEPSPFFISGDHTVRLFHATSMLRKGLPVVIKRHDIYFLSKSDFLHDINRVVNAGLAQARVEHSHSCKILELNLDLDPAQNTYSVLHVLEALERDLSKDIEQRQRHNMSLDEGEIRRFLREMGEAVAFAHSKNIAHRDIKPQNVFLDKAGCYKLGDFGCYYERKGTAHTESLAGTLPYMSPQQRSIIAGKEVKYDVFKNDVYALGVTAISLATLNMPNLPYSEERLASLVRGMRCSQELVSLLLAMTANSEDARPTMLEVLARVGGKSAEKPPIPILDAPISVAEEAKQVSSPQLAYIEDTHLHLYSLTTSAWSSVALTSPTAVDEGSMYLWTEEDLFCSGGMGINKKGTKSAFQLVYSQEWRLNRLPDMSDPRYYHGLWWSSPSHSVLVFGGKPYAGRSNS
jgi:serine/threonine protein kinase